MTQERTQVKNEDANATSPLDALYGEAYVVLGGGRRVDVSKLKVRYIQRALTLVSSIFRKLNELSLGAKPDDPQLSFELLAAIADRSAPVNVSAILQLIADNWEEAFELIRLHTSLDKKDTDDLDIDDAVILIAAVVKRNASFFERTVVPLLIQLAAEVTVAVESDVATSPPKA